MDRTVAWACSSSEEGQKTEIDISRKTLGAIPNTVPTFGRVR